MWVSVLSIIAYLVPFILEAWKSGTLGRKEEADYEKTQRGRSDIVNGNTGALELRVDRLLANQARSSNSVAGLPNTADAQKRLDAL